MSRITRREFTCLAPAGLLALGTGSLLSSSLHAEAPAFDLIPYVNPQLRAMVDSIRRFTVQPWTLQTLAARRKAQFAFPPKAQPGWIERVIPGPKGAPDVRVYVVNAGAGATLRPAILHLHGGGFIAGDAKSAIRGCQDMASALDCVVVTVDYRLAPETRFPGSLEDNYAALKWLYGHAAEIGVDRARIAVMGESAGGGHAAMLAIAARDRGEIPLVFQALIYPMLDDRTGSSRKMPPYLGAIVWKPEDNRFGWTALLGVPAGSRKVPYGAVPARIESLKGLPPAFIGVGSIDLFVEEDIDYARRLIDAGVAAELNVVPGAFHGFDIAASKAPISLQFNAALIAALARAFKPTDS